jgi:fatty-acyl-CoA synthase
MKTSGPFSVTGTLSAMLEARGREHGERVAFEDASGKLTYGELDGSASSMAASMADAGIVPGDRVVIVLPSGLPLVRTFWALQRLGATPCVLNPTAPATLLADRLSVLRPALVVVEEKKIDTHRAAAAGARLVSVEELSCGATPRGFPTGSGDDLAWLQPTSGTSGEPRFAMVRQQNILAFLAAMYEIITIREGDTYVQWVPPWHDLGLVRFVIGTVYAGTRCVIVEPAVRTIPLWLETMARERATLTAAPDFAWRMAAKLGDPSLDLRSLRFAVNGGEAVRIGTVRMFEEKYGLTNVLRPSYGLAEATLSVSSYREGEPVRVDARGTVSCGRRLPGLEVRIDGEEGAPGEILARGPTIFPGYFEAPQSTEAVLDGGWLRTGDIGYFDEDGWLYVLGRQKAMIKRGGAVLAPRQLEEAAQSVTGVKIAAAIGLAPDESRSTEEIVVVVEPDGSAAPAAAVTEGVRQAVSRSLGFAPDRVLVLQRDRIPRTWNGKIRHAALREAVAAGELA